MNLLRFDVGEEEEGMRIDRYLVQELEEAYSRSYLKTLFAKDLILLNEKAVKPSCPVTAGDRILLSLPEQELPSIVPEDIPLSILYEDDDLLVVNKEKGMVVHPSHGHWSGTLVNAVMHHCLLPDGTYSLSGINGILRPGIVHRIDKDTSGALLICKTDAAHKIMADALKEHALERKYAALVYGILKEDTFTIDQPIGRDVKDRKKMAVRKDGKRAVTHVRVLERFEKKGDLPAATLIECRLETGRTHQIRVHMAFCGHPVLGDPVYAGRRRSVLDGTGQFLHAKTLGFTHPRTGEEIHTEAPLPAVFEEALRRLRSAP